MVKTSRRFPTCLGLSAVRVALLGTALSGAWLSAALGAEPVAQRGSAYSGWGAGLMTVSLIDSVKKEAPVRGADPALAAPPTSTGGEIQIAQGGR